VPDAGAPSKKLEEAVRIEKKPEDSLKNAMPPRETGVPAGRNNIPETDPEVKIYDMPKRTAPESRIAETADNVKNAAKNSMGSGDAQNSYNDVPFGTDSLKNPERPDRPMPSLPKAGDINDEFMDVSAILNKYVQPSSNTVSYDAKLDKFATGHSEAPDAPAVDSSHAQGLSAHSATSSDLGSGASSGKDRTAGTAEGPKVIASAAPKKASDDAKSADSANAVKTGIKLSDILNVHRLFTHEPFKSSRTARMDNDSSSSSEYSSMSSDYSATKAGRGPMQPPRPKLPPRPSESAIKVIIPHQKTGPAAEKMPTATTAGEPADIKQGGTPEKKVSLS